MRIFNERKKGGPIFFKYQKKKGKKKDILMLPGEKHGEGICKHKYEKERSSLSLMRGGVRSLGRFFFSRVGKNIGKKRG